MRNRGLHDALRAFALEAAHLLRSDQNAGAEIEFELDEGGGSGPTLYHYRPLSSRFIAQRWDRLRTLASCTEAAAALEGGASAYLRHHGLHDGGGSEPALAAMLETLYEEATDFNFPEARFETVYAEVEQTLYERRQQATVLVPVHGLELRGEHVDLGDGLELVRGDRTDAPDESVWGDPADPTSDSGREQPNALLRLTRDIDPEDPLPLAEARERFFSVLTTMRLLKPGGVALAAVAWRRTGDGRWQPFELEPTGAARGAPWILVDGEERQLSELLAAIDPVPRSGTVAWALRRFGMGCGRHQETEALTDYLLALRALVDGSSEPGHTSLALRVAVLCASEGERKRVQRRLELAQALERFVVGDGAGDDYLDSVGSDSPATLVDEAERHLRALLRDVLCGYLRSDLRSVADDLLLEQPEPFQIKASAAAASKAGPAKADRPRRTVARNAPTGRFARRSDTGAIDADAGLAAEEQEQSREIALAPVGAEAGPAPEPSLSQELEQAEAAGHVDPAQLDFDDDPESYSAPV